MDAYAGKLTANESYINQCVVYNNEAGLIAEVANKGGGIYIAGKGYCGQHLDLQQRKRRSAYFS